MVIIIIDKTDTGRKRLYYNRGYIQKKAMLPSTVYMNRYPPMIIGVGYTESVDALCFSFYNRVFEFIRTYIRTHHENDVDESRCIYIQL